MSGRIARDRPLALTCAGPVALGDLTVPLDGSRTARDVLSRAMRRLLDDLRALKLPEGASPAARAALRTTRDALAEVLRRDPGAAISVLRRPTIGAPLRCLRDGTGGDIDALVADLAGQALFELATTSALSREVRLELLPPRLISLARRVVVDVPPGTRAASFAPGRVVLDGAPIDLEAPEHARRLVAIPGTPAVLALADDNPLAMFEAHPDKHGNAIDLGGRDVSEWTASLGAALDLAGAYLPALRAEADLYIQQFVPVGYDEERHSSASYREAIGTIYLTLHPSLMTMTEAVVHELQHNKLNAQLELDPLLEDAFAPVHRSPVRPDPRPLHGVLLAVHAFLPIAILYERMIAAGDPRASRPEFRARFEQIVKTNREAAEVVLANGRPTPLGAELLDEIRRLDAHFRATT